MDGGGECFRRRGHLAAPDDRPCLVEHAHLAGVQPLRTHWATFRQAAVTNLLNPKAYMFMLAVFPQFLRVEHGPVWQQALVLGAIIAGTQAGVYGALALAAGSARGWLGSRPSAGLALNRGGGLVLILAAAITGIGGWRTL